MNEAQMTCMSCGAEIPEDSDEYFSCSACDEEPFCGDCVTTAGECFECSDDDGESEEDSTKPKIDSTTIEGCWSSPLGNPTCSKCGSKMTQVPREGHPNSHYWRLEKADGMLLVACSKMCLESAAKKEKT